MVRELTGYEERKEAEKEKEDIEHICGTILSIILVLIIFGHREHFSCLYLCDFSIKCVSDNRSNV